MGGGEEGVGGGGFVVFRQSRRFRVASGQEPRPRLHEVRRLGVRDALRDHLLRDGFGDRSVLIDIGTKFGYDSIEVKKYLFSDKDIVETLDQNHSTLRLGISGIPAFIFDDKFSISGAQDNKILLRMLNIAEDDVDDATMQNIQPYLKGKQDHNDL